MAESDADAFWRFSLAFYARPGVSDACLAAQDRLGADVNLLLYMLFLALRGQAVEPEAVRHLDGRVATWRREVVERLRAVRRWLKTADPGSALRREVQRLELEAERQEQALLAGEPPTCAETDPDTAAEQNLAACLRLLGADGAESTRALLRHFVDFRTAEPATQERAAR
ncbi:MAG: TIGR02444 family protein [Acidisphaera sp.]|nr:TIGR02444 family protein [Acidisphaera sp.]